MYQTIAVIILLSLLVNYWKFIVIIGLIGLIIFLIKHFLSSKPISNSNYPSSSADSLIIPSLFPKKDYQNSNFQTNISLSKNIPDIKARWIPHGQSITILDHTIPDGMIYTGQTFKNIDNTRYYPPRCLINPKLGIDTNDCDYRRPENSYWSDYANMSPKERNCYLTWLSKGKNDPEAAIEYVFLYFDGLEYRLLADTKKNVEFSNEYDLILAEIKRLSSVYSKHYLFTRYANSLYSYFTVDKYRTTLRYTEPEPAPELINHQGLPIDLKIGIGQMARDQIPLPAEWALNWYLSTLEPPIYARTAARRCYAEFKQLFTNKYGNKFPNGLLIKPNKTKLYIDYEPRNSHLPEKLLRKAFDLPDVSVLKKYINQFAPLIQECHDELDRYSRFLGRNPGKENTLDALLELSPYLWPNESVQKFNQIATDIQTNSIPATMKFSDLLIHLPIWEKVTKVKMIAFLDIMENYFHLGIEPDCRINGKLPVADSNIVLFFQENQPSQNDLTDSTYSFATLILHLNILVSQADGEASTEEMNAIMKKIDEWAWITTSTKPRLKAFAEWLSTQDLNMTGIKKRLEDLDNQQKELIGTLLIQIAKADGTVSVEEMKLLEKLFKLLNLYSTALYNQINQSEFEPVTVSINDYPSNEYAISLPPDEKIPSEIKIDMNKLTALKADSEKVSVLLNEIFEDDTEQSIPSSQTQNPNTEKENCIWNLSLELSNLVRILITKPMWTTSELEQLAKNHSLMLEGSLEEINDNAFDYFDEPLVEEIENGFEINQDIMEEIENE